MSTAPGGGVDTVTRIFAALLQQRLGQPFIIENCGGGGGNIGAEGGLRRRGPTATRSLRRSRRRSPANAAALQEAQLRSCRLLEPVAVMSENSLTRLLRGRIFPAKTGTGIHRLCLKPNPGEGRTYASQGLRARPPTSRGSLFVQLPTGIEAPARSLSRHGASYSTTSLAGSCCDFIFMGVSRPLYKLQRGREGKDPCRRIGARLALLPDIPTLIEAGVPGLVSDTWNALSAPPKTPASIVAKLNGAINEFSRSRKPRLGSGSSISCPAAAPPATWLSSRPRRRSAGPG